MALREVRIEPAGTPGRLYDPGEGRGLVLLGHGAGGSKDDPRFVALGREIAAGTGLAVACIDAIGHGERDDPDQGDEAARRSAGNADRMIADWQATADALASETGPAIAYVGFSMGMVYGAPTVAAMPSIKVAVFGVGGLPGEDPTVHTWLLDVARRLEHPQVLMLNMTKDAIFSVPGTHAFFDAIPGRKKRLMFWEGDHVGLPAESIRHAVAFVKKHTS